MSGSVLVRVDQQNWNSFEMYVYIDWDLTAWAVSVMLVEVWRAGLKYSIQSSQVITAQGNYKISSLKDERLSQSEQNLL